MIYAWIPLILAAVLIFLDRFLNKKQTSFPYLSALGILLFVLIGFKGYFTDAFPSAVFGYTEVDAVLYDKRILLAFVRWAVLFSEVVAVTYAWTKSPAMRRVAARASLPLSVLSLCFLTPTLACYTAKLPAETWNFGIALPAWLRIALYLVEISLCIAIGVMALLVDRKSTANIGHNAQKHTFVGAVCTMPFLTQGAFFGEGEHVITIADPLQFLWIALIIGMLLGIYFLYRNAEEKEKTAIMTFLSVYLFTHYNSIYWNGVTLRRLPLQLCNLAAYLFVLLLFFRSQKFFDFLFVATTAGCIIAIATVTEETPMFGFWAMHYFVEHTYVYVIPLLYVLLGLYQMPRGRKAIHHFGVGYTSYVALCVFLNAIANGILATAPNLNHEIFNDANFFYTRACPVSALADLFNTINVGSFTIFGTTFSIGYLSFVYFVFAALALLEYLGYLGIAKLVAKVKAKRKSAVTA